MWPAQPFWAFAGLVLLGLGHAAVLAIEFALAAASNRQDATPQATAAQWIKAWWQEVKVAPVVFAWHQPFFWQRWPDDTQASDTLAAPVVLVHGFVCNRGFWLPWMKILRENRIPYVSVNLEPVFGSIDDYPALIEDAVCRAERLCARAPVLVCHSMGGLVARAWLVGQSDPSRVAAVVTIGTPHRGTWLARFSGVINGKQMLLEGEWLKGLEPRERLLGPDPYARFECWYSNTDNIVFPSSTATLPGAHNQLLEGAAHVGLAFEPAVMASVLERVRPPSFGSK